MLPLLHRSLESGNRVICSNAARACGAIGDPSSIPRLIKALDLESGLSRASIVWALGELRAQPAVPSLITLYVDARNDEKRHGGSGYRSGQAKAAMNSEYERISTLGAISTEWNELKASGRPEVLDPATDEHLLSRRDILDAIRKIGPGPSREFYLALAGDTEPEGRYEAAIGLAGGKGNEREKNLPVLRGLLGDESVGIRMQAAVSLLMSGEDGAQAMILQWLDSKEPRERVWIIRLLHRVKEPSKLAFAISRLKAIAGDLTLDRETREAAQKLLNL